MIYQNNLRKGWGRHIQSNGDYYIGFYDNNQRNGKGILYKEDGSIIHQGDFVNNLY